MTTGYRFDKAEHLHTLDGKPLTGTSTVTNVLNKPLTWWASGKAVESLGWTNPKVVKGKDREDHASPYFNSIKNIDIKEYVKMLDKAYRAHNEYKKDAADKGTDLHAELEAFVKDSIAGQVGIYPEQIIPFITWSKENVDRFLVSEGHCYSRDLWTGGITDAIAVMKNGKNAVIDFKSAKAVYTSHVIQTGGYALEVESNGIFDAEGNQVMEPIKIDELIVVPFGSLPLTPVRYTGVDDFMQGFKHVVGIYRLIKKYE